VDEEEGRGVDVARVDLVWRAEEGELLEAGGSADGVRRGVEEELPARDLRGITAEGLAWATLLGWLDQIRGYLMVWGGQVCGKHV